MAVGKKKVGARRAKSSAMVVSLGIHALLIVVAVSFVAVTVIKQEDAVFEVKNVSRPKVPLKKLQVPVDVKKRKTQKPKLRKRIVVKPKLNQAVPEIRMPEITGVKGGMGNAAGDGLGGAGGVGFSMPEINIFGVKGKGEKIFIILDSTPDMMVNSMGGIPAYTLIKAELVKILGKLNPAVLFNIAVYDRGPSRVLFPKMVTASDENVAKVKAWLDPLNAVSQGMGDRDYGIRTLGGVSGAKTISGDFKAGKLQTQREWVPPIMLSMQERADAVFLLAHGWGTLWHVVEGAEQWSESKRARWNQAVTDSKRKHKEENERLRKAGKPPRVFSTQRTMVRAYYPNIEQPPASKKYLYTAKDVGDAMVKMRGKSRKITPMTSGISKNNNKFTVNIIHFVSESGARDRDAGKFKELAGLFRGEYRTLSGMAAIKSSALQE